MFRAGLVKEAIFFVLCLQSSLSHSDSVLTPVSKNGRGANLIFALFLMQKGARFGTSGLLLLCVGSRPIFA